MKKNWLSKLFVLVLCLAMLACVLAGCKKDPEPQPGDEYTGANTLVVGYSRFSQKFSPFFSKTAYDQDAAAMTQLSLLTTDRQGNVIYKGIEGETVKYNGKDYKYSGISDITVTMPTEADTNVYYNIKIRDDITFSDGVAMTIDDVIFNMYVLSDPTYDGSSTFYAQAIAGMKEYRAGMKSRASLIIAQGRTYVANDYFTEAQNTTYWAAVDTAGVALVNGIKSFLVNNGYVTETATIAECMAMWGYAGLPAETTAAQAWAVIEANYPSITEANAEAGEVDLFEAITTALGDQRGIFEAGVVTGTTAANIAGITKVDNYNVKVTMTEFDATSIYQLGLSVAPLHYYGSTAKYDYDANKFGFDKGDLSSVRAKTTAPMGAGAYKFIKYENGVIFYERNETYYKGSPKITYIQFKETDDADKVSGVQAGTFDITDPSFSNTAVSAVKAANSNGELNGNVITTNTVDNLGYGYIGINAANVCVGGDSDSAASKNLRKGFATLFAAYRETAISSYYGDRAAVINYPISNTSWAAPQATDEDYAIAFSKDVEGKTIYTADMTAEQRLNAATAAAVGFFKAAGYTYDEATSKFTAAPAGAKMEYELIIPGDGTGDHPNFAIVTWASEVLEGLGITLTINDPADSNVLWDKIEAGTQDMWTAAWGATVDPDMYQVYYSTNVVGGEGGTDSNHYHITDAELDRLIMAARKSADNSYRKATYKECLDIIGDWAVEIPVYQRQNAVIFSSARVNMETVTPDITTFWGWMNDIEELEMK